jgi:transglutaminase/protease-like cytokinesis protein 3
LIRISNRLYFIKKTIYSINYSKQATLLVLFILNFAFPNYSYSQNFTSVDSIVDNYPLGINNTDKLVEYINKDFIRQEEKARAIFRWVTSNISYDVVLADAMDKKSINAFSYKTENERKAKEKQFKLDLVAKTMNSKKAVCHGYASLIEDLCIKLGMESRIILGYLKSDPSQIGEIPVKSNHAWNMIKIGNNWQFLDATLGAGFISSNTNLFKFQFNEGYFFTDYKRFFLNHYPSEVQYLLIDKSKNDFAQLPLFFGAYLKNNYQIITSTSGLIIRNDNLNFTFDLKGIDSYDTVSYSNDVDNKIINFASNDAANKFVIPLNDKNVNFISIYVNRKIIAMYKII